MSDHPLLLRLISGGQSGVDVAGLVAGKLVGLETGGVMPRGFRTLLGPKPEYARLFGVREHSSPAYPPRTECNVMDSDGTIQIATDWNSPGEKLTSRLIDRHGKPCFAIGPGHAASDPQAAAEWIAANKIRTLNVAGNSHATSPAIGLFALEFLLSVFAELGFHVLEEKREAHRRARERFSTGPYAH